jgi:hypothetical protein
MNLTTPFDDPQALFDEILQESSTYPKSDLLDTGIHVKCPTINNVGATFPARGGGSNANF